MTQKITGLKKRISMKDPSSSSLNLRNKDSEDHTFREKDLHEGSFLLFSKPQEQGLRRSHTSGTRTQKITRSEKRISMKDPSSSSLDLRDKDSEDTCSEKRISMKDPSSSSLNLRNKDSEDTRSEKRISMKDPSSSSLDLRNKDSEDHTFREKDLHEGSFLLLSRPQEQGLRRTHVQRKGSP
ncbi:RNA-binding protein 6 [Dissostichus eleginoides]|uniref:RNA-binding protein 6 n=1 Tax=Dissostichus eleginoides TaxID=100907 RepID=A0AAD9ERV9_DISEL|nr:RNA-binding protein 6 [Dissostichus eleginoides]